LGSGKTVFARGLIHGLGVGAETHVTSPTFVIVSEYLGRLPIHHVDAYRLSGPVDIVNLGSRELFFEDAVSVVEWADRIEEALPEDRLEIHLEVTGVDSRRITVSAPGETHGGLPGKLGKILVAEKEGGPS
jgi:tRNA threonylcarbamoyladenosine biosynthesis protein TsaE